MCRIVVNLEGSRAVKTEFLRSVVVSLGLGACTAAQAQFGGAVHSGWQVDQGTSGSLGMPTATVPVQGQPVQGQSVPAQGIPVAVPRSEVDYRAPAKWNRFLGLTAAPDSTLFRPVSGQSNGPPSPHFGPLGGLAPPAVIEPTGGAEEIIGSGRRGAEEAVPAGAAVADGYSHHPSQQFTPFSDATSSWITGGTGAGLLDGRPTLSPWFGGFNLLFLNVENADNVRLLYDDADPSMSRLWSADVDPSAAVGFDLSVGRYLADGRYGLGLTYFYFDPSGETALVAPGAAGDYQPAMPGWNNLSIDPSGGVNPGGVANEGLDSVYNYYDEAAAFRARRSMDFQGIELNFFSFGIMGAQRAAACGGHGLLDGMGKLGRRLGLHGGTYGDQACGGPSCGPTYGFGGAAGPLVRPCSGRIQVVASHGFRWFQFRDAFGFDANINGMPGYQLTDLYYDVDTENNLYGYQFGGRLIYCLSNRINLAIGGKFGLYGNDVRYRQRIGTGEFLSTYNSDPAQQVLRHGSETVLSTLGELDFGLGYRVCNAWTVRGGYRILGATGVATSVGSISQDFASPEPNSAVYAGDSIVLHGGYVGLEYNW